MSNRKLSGGQLFAEESSVPAGHPNNLEPRYSLRQAAARFFPDGPITLASLAGKRQSAKAATMGPQAGTWRWLCEEYMRAADSPFRRIDPLTQRTRRGI